MQLGALVKFGRFVWRVLAVKEDTALLLSEEMTELRAYHNQPGEITWADSEIREYLNGAFYNSFSEDERARIVATEIDNYANPWFATDGGSNTVDKIFLLSIEEVVCKYFGDSSENLKLPNGKYKYWFQRKDGNNEKRRATYLGYPWWWWLRSPGRKPNKAVYVHGDGNIGIQGNNAQKCNISGVYHPADNDVRGGIRPALWIKLR